MTGGMLAVKRACLKGGDTREKHANRGCCPSERPTLCYDDVLRHEQSIHRL